MHLIGLVIKLICRYMYYFIFSLLIYSNLNII